MEGLIGQIIQEEYELMKNRIFTRINRIPKDGIQTSDLRSMKLQFRNGISRIILTGEEIKGEEHTCIEVALIDDTTGNVIDVGPESSANIEIVVLRGEFAASEDDDWTAENFNENIVRVEGKMPILAGNVILKLQRGTCLLENIKFRHHTSKMKPPVFRLGARFVRIIDGVPVKEAKTESFTVKDYRNKYFMKCETPALSDEVWRLKNIRKGGNIDNRLKDNKIYKVEDFLIRLLVDPKGLKRIVNLGAKKWEVTVNHAQACPSDKRMYCYINSQQQRGIVFNILGQVLGLYSENQYSPTNMLPENHKDLLASAYEHWENTVPFDDENTLHQHITSLSGLGNAGTSEMMGETSNRFLNSYSSQMMDLTGESSG
ncbi:hypothetical protein ACJIZ3_004553 [Penstemon smallii]|uniref:Uncharacterized protein n=1 Tax=Penstemon smallii TaxID=265156 RepID=A0ABD3S2C9_9LAMI